MTDTQILAMVIDDCQEAIRVCQSSGLRFDFGMAAQAQDTLDLIEKHRERPMMPLHSSQERHIERLTPNVIGFNVCSSDGNHADAV